MVRAAGMVATRCCPGDIRQLRRTFDIGRFDPAIAAGNHAREIEPPARRQPGADFCRQSRFEPPLGDAHDSRRRTVLCHQGSGLIKPECPEIGGSPINNDRFAASIALPLDGGTVAICTAAVKGFTNGAARLPFVAEEGT